MRRFNRMNVAGLGIFLGLLISSPVYAEWKDLLLYFQPSIIVEEEYNDNIYLTPGNRKADFITTLSPGFRFSTIPRSQATGQFPEAAPSAEMKYGVVLDYRLGLVYYGKEEDNNFVAHRGTLDAWYILGRWLTFRVRNSLIRSDEVREPDYSEGAQPGQYLLSTQRGVRAAYLRNVFEPSVEYQFGKENRVFLRYRSNIYQNESRLYEDSREDFINPKLVYWFNIRNGVSLEYGLTFADFDRSPDFTGHMAAGRYTRRFNPRTSVFGEYAFLNRDFRAPGVDYDVHRPSLGVEHAFSPTLSGRAQLGYFWQNPAKGSTKTGPFYEFWLSQRMRRTTYTVAFQGGYNEDYFTSENLGFSKYHRALGSVTHRLLEKLALKFTGSAERARFGDGRTDRIWGLGAGASYQVLRWLLVSLDVSHRECHSNIDPNDYRENRAILRMIAAF